MSTNFSSFSVWRIVMALALLPIFTALQAKGTDSLTVYVFMSEACPVCQNQTLPLRELYTQFKDQRVGFVAVFSNPSSQDSTILFFRAKYGLRFPAVFDSNQQIAKRLTAKITPEVVVVNHADNDAIVYRGAVDNAYPTLGKRRSIVTQHFLKDALIAIRNGSKDYVATTEPVGCYITF
jgi:thiol-disulfide isomerase/thioredoxin